MPLLGQARCRRAVAPVGHDLLHERLVRGEVVERGVPTDEQGLRQERLEPSMRLRRDAIFMRAAGRVRVCRPIPGGRS